MAEVILALPELIKPPASIILPSAPAQRGLGKTDEGRWMEWSFKEGDIAKRIEETPGVRIALQPTPPMGKKNQRQVRPFGLRLDPTRQGAEIRPKQCLFGDQDEPRTCAELRDQPFHRIAGHAFDPRLAKDASGDYAIAPGRREDEGPFRA
jgi:hypothetical protein